MALLSCWGEVTTENEAEVVAANRTIHPKLEQLLSLLSDILNEARIEYWLDQGTLLGAHRNGKFIPRDSDVDLAIRSEEHFAAVPELLEAHLPSAYDWERKGSHCGGYRVWLKAGGSFRGSFEGKEIEWPLVACDLMFYRHRGEDNSYSQQYQGFGVDALSIPEGLIFPLSAIEFEKRAYPCPSSSEEYLTIQYGYIGEGAIWDPGSTRWIQG
jgi:hypothetical protein